MIESTTASMFDSMLSVGDIHNLAYVVVFCLVGWVGLMFRSAVRR